MPSKEWFQMKIKTISFILLLCFSIGFLSAENEDPNQEPNQKSSEVIEENVSGNQKPKTEIKSAQKTRKRENEDTIIPSEQISEDFAVAFPVDI